MFTIWSNYTEIGTADTLKEAKALAITESTRYDDVVTIDKGGDKVYMAQYGTLYALRATK